MAKNLTSLSIFISLLILQAKAQTEYSNDGRFPFPGNDAVFELRRENDTTAIRFSSYGHDLVVKSISYEAERLDLDDPRRCVHEVFLNLDISELAPFRYYYAVKNYTYLNCSAELSPGFAEIPCLSARGSHVYTVEPSMEAPSYCRRVKSVAIPFEYSPYLADDSFGLALTWASRETPGGGFKVGLVQVLAIGVAVFALVSAFTTINKAIYYSKMKKPVSVNEGLGSNNKVEIGKFMRDYSVFSSSNDHEAYVDQVSNRC